LNSLLKEIRQNSLLWLLAFVPVVVYLIFAVTLYLLQTRAQ